MTDQKLAHPNPDQLTAFAQGRLAEAEWVELSSHLTSCNDCLTIVEASGDDTLISLLRAADPAKDAQNASTLPGPAKPATLPGLSAELTAHGRYRVQGLLGVGGMGAVYKAEHLLMERPVALKLISHELTSNPAMVERFRREVKTAAKLKHPNIVMAYDAEQEGDVHFLVMEFVEGESLARLVAEQGPLPVQQACDYIRQAAVGLQHAHERGMVHRDIKPQNLMRTPDGQVKILDFGLARFAMETAPTGALLAVSPTEPPAENPPNFASLTQVGTVMGTPDYIAPEQAQNAHAADIRADIYSLGCTLYDLLAGHAPFPEGTAVAKVMAHVERSPKPITELRKDMPPALARVVERMMAKDPAKRYQTPAEVAQALAPFAATTPRKPGLGRRAWVAAAALAVALLAGVVIYVQTDKGEFEIQTNDENIAVMVNQKGVRIRDQVSGREYLLKAGKQDVRTGIYGIVVSELPEGIEIESDKPFTVTRGGKAIAIARLRAKSEPPSAAKSTPEGNKGQLLEGHSEAVMATAISPDGRLAATAGGGQVHPNGRRAEKGKDFAIRLWDLSKNRELHRLEGHTDLVTRVTFSPNSHRLASASVDKLVRLWNVDNGQLVAFWQAGEQAVMSVAFSPDGKRLVTAGWDDDVRVWTAGSPKRVLSIGHKLTQGGWHQAVYSPNGRFIAACGVSAVAIFDAETGKLVRSFEVNNMEPRFTSIAYSGDGKRLLTASQFDGLAGHHIRIWDAESGQQTAEFQGGSGAAFAAHDGHLILAGGADDSDLVLVDLEKRRAIGRFQGHHSTVLSISVTSDGRRAVSGSADNRAFLWQLSDEVEAQRPAVVKVQRNPFGVPDVEDPDGDDIRAFAEPRNLKGGADDENADEWVSQTTAGTRNTLDGEWFGREKDKNADWEHLRGRVQFKTVGDRVFILFTDHEGRWLIEARREKNRLIGCMQGVDKRRDWRGPCLLVIVSPERIDGEGQAHSRLDFRRKLEQTDQQKIQGTWKGVAAGTQGQPIPELVFKAVGPTITFNGDKVTWKAKPTPEAKEIFQGILTKFYLEGVVHLDPTKSPKTIDLTILGQNAKTPLGTPAPRALLGIYKLEGDTLELCMAIDPDHTEDRPTKFESIPGKFIAHIKLQRVAPPKEKESK